LFEKTKEVKEGRYGQLDKTVALLFFEPSTRTYGSFDSAAKRMGCKVIGIQDPDTASLKKGESTYDTVRMFVGYGADALVIRHPRAGAPKYVAEAFDVPVINGGDDGHEHPTQAMLDLFTIWEKFGGFEGLKVGIMGDLRYGRTASSLAYGLAKWGVRMRFIAPDLLQIHWRNDRLEEQLREMGADFEKTDQVKLDDLDVLYVTRIQKERFVDETEYKKVKGSFHLGQNSLKGVKNKMIILHPLPRVDELSPDIDRMDHAWYFRQAENGLYVRMALLELILGD